MRRERIYMYRRRAAAIVVLIALLFVVEGISAFAGRGIFASDPQDPLRPITSTPRPSAAPASTPSEAGRNRLNIYAAIAPGHMSPRVAGVRELVYVPNSTSASVDVIDPKTFRVIRHFKVGEYPQHITPSWDLRWLYVNDTLSNTLVVINPRTGKPTGRVIPVRDPYNLYFTPDGTKAIVVAESLQRVDFRNPHTWKLIKSVPVPASGPNHLDFSADGRFFLLSTEFGGYVVKVDTVSMRVVGKVRLGGSPVDVRLSPDGRAFFVANQVAGGVFVLSPKTLHQLAFIPTGAGAHGLIVSRDARFLYVSNRIAGTISVVGFHRRAVVNTWHVGGSPDMMQLSPDGSQLWVSNRWNGTVSVISTRTGEVLHVIRVGGSPHGLTLFPQPGRYSLGHNGMYR
jgi:YVTN family beta-propeller protein